jgi:hypothetical protein
MPMAPDAFGDFNFLRIWHVDHVCPGVWFCTFVQFEDSFPSAVYISCVVNVIQLSLKIILIILHTCRDFFGPLKTPI